MHTEQHMQLNRLTKQRLDKNHFFRTIFLSSLPLDFVYLTMLVSSNGKCLYFSQLATVPVNKYTTVLNTDLSTMLDSVSLMQICTYTPARTQTQNKDTKYTPRA